MAVQLDEAYDREKFALYVAGLMPDDFGEAKAALSLVGRLLLTLQESREAQESREVHQETADQRDD
jgi:hypothetical protein